jgi:hypothetical protein
MTPHELQQLVGKFRTLHRVNGAIIVTFEVGKQLFTEYAFTAHFATSWNDPDKEALLVGVPTVLRQIADEIESRRDSLKLQEFKPE